jgi:YfiR/HmsC-like
VDISIMMSMPLVRAGCLSVASVALATSLLEAPPVAAESGAQVGRDISAVKAGFLYNFAKFAEWPALASAAPIVMCVAGDEKIAGALAETVREQKISGHALDVLRPADNATWRSCHLLFIADAELRRSAEGLGALKTLQVLSVSDQKDFAQTGGIIEFYLEGGKMRFAINVDAVDRSGLRLSSRLLGLARIIRDRHVP